MSATSRSTQQGVPSPQAVSLVTMVSSPRPRSARRPHRSQGDSIRKPAPAIAGAGEDLCASGGEAVGVARSVPALQPDLVRAAPAEHFALEEEALVKTDAAALGDVQLGHPGAYAVRVELLVPRTVERVGEVDALAVAGDLAHLRAAGQWLIRPRRVRHAPDNAAEPDRADLARVERVAHVVLLQFAGAPARDVE